MKLLVIGGSDAGIMAALRARELDPSTEVTMMMADAYPNLSICGLPYALSGEVPDWQALRHRTIEEIAATRTAQAAAKGEERGQKIWFDHMLRRLNERIKRGEFENPELTNVSEEDIKRLNEEELRMFIELLEKLGVTA